MKQISLEDLDDLARGATILGSGGGGDPACDLMVAKQQLAKTGPVKLVDVDDIEDEALVVPLEYIGAPLVSIEMLPSGDEFQAILEAISERYGQCADYLLPVEIGGGNAFTPLIVASQYGLPVIDGDTLGRAFPELQMSSCNLFGVSASPAFIAGITGGCKILYAEDAMEMEDMCRKEATANGSSAALSLYLMTGKQAKEAIIKNTLSQAIRIGKTKDLDVFVREGHGALLCQGTIIDIDQKIQNSFLVGKVTIETEKGIYQIDYQNEYLVVRHQGEVVGMTPDILALFEIETAIPIPSESLAYGLRVALMVFPGPDIWYTKAGKDLISNFQCLTM